MQTLADAVHLWKEKGDESALLRLIQPMELLTSRKARIVVKDSAAASLSQGAPLMRPGIISMPSNLPAGSEISLMTVKGELVALAEMQYSTDDVQTMEHGEVARSNTVLLETGTYPRHES